jgi:hypothetical protein
MNTKRILTFAAAFAWAGLAVSAAAPADALVAFANQGGSFATCASGNSPFLWSACGYDFAHYQHIKLVATSCNAGGCTSDKNANVDFIYSTGRKTTSLVISCGFLITPYYVYGLGTCAC